MAGGLGHQTPSQRVTTSPQATGAHPSQEPASRCQYWAGALSGFSVMEECKAAVEIFVSKSREALGNLNPLNRWLAAWKSPAALWSWWAKGGWLKSTSLTPGFCREWIKISQSFPHPAIHLPTLGQGWLFCFWIISQPAAISSLTHRDRLKSTP